MVLHVHSDASYLSEPKARSRAAGHFFFGPTPDDPNKPPANQPPRNGAIHTLCQILRNVMASAAEAEVGAIFVNEQEAVPIRTTAIELGHQQPPTPLQTDNSTASGFANGTIKQKRSKAMDMRFYWIKDREQQEQFLVYWRPGKENRADYHSKHHSTSHHRTMRHNYLLPEPTTNLLPTPTTKPNNQNALRGCVTSLRRPSAHPGRSASSEPSNNQSILSQALELNKSIRSIATERLGQRSLI
jgi:hypothetical protein